LASSGNTIMFRLRLFFQRRPNSLDFLEHYKSLIHSGLRIIKNLTQKTVACDITSVILHENGTWQIRTDRSRGGIGFKVASVWGA
jgi:hypothetical protein